MQRHGWAFCLGLLAIGAAAAQPPADLERYPPAPNLPGVVIGQTATTIQAADKTDKTATPAGELPFEPIQQPKDKPAAPKETVLPDATAVPPTALPAKTACAGPVCKPSCGAGCCERIAAWLLHRSRAKQSAHYPSPYTPPLHAWFPCEPRAGCGGKCDAGIVHGAPTVIPPTDVTPLPPPAVMPPKSPVTALPAPHEPKSPAIPEPTSELPPSFQGVNVGVKFTPGAAPMAKPTTQTEKVSNWRPK